MHTHAILCAHFRIVTVTGSQQAAQNAQMMIMARIEQGSQGQSQYGSSAAAMQQAYGQQQNLQGAMQLQANQMGHQSVGSQNWGL